MYHLLDVYLWAQVIKISVFVVYAVVFVVLEKVARSVLYIASLFIPIAVIDWCRARFHTSVPRLLRGFKDEEEREPVELNFDAPELITARGFPFEEHYADTPDGFRLAMHRIPPRRTPSTSPISRATAAIVAAATSANSASGVASTACGGDSDSKASSDSERAGGASGAPVVYIMHGFLQSSECFVANERCLAFALSRAGFDVWLGNMRGNKYSCKHARLSPHSEEYWNFSMDEVALHDVPACLTYILNVTGAPTLTYIGFSQGTAVAFAAFSQRPDLVRRVNLFVALAPATLAVGFTNRLLDSLAKISPDLVYLIFGRTSLLSTCLFWQNVMSTRLFCATIDRACEFLFGWDMANIAAADKPLLYSHIYSYSSVKSVVHWFQLMRSKRFQVYDDTKWKGPQSSYAYAARRVPGYPINQIACPIALFYGGRDFLVDTPSLLQNLPHSTFQHEEPSYEHMDFLYAHNANQRIYNKIVTLVTHVTAATAAGTAVLPLPAVHSPTRPQLSLTSANAIVAAAAMAARKGLPEVMSTPRADA